MSQFNPLFKKESKKKDKRPKVDFKAKCLEVLAQIEELSPERYQDLMRLFKSQYDKVNIQKKKIMGFYALLMSEWKTLRQEVDMGIDKAQEVIKTTKKAAKKIIKNPSMKEVSKAVNKISEATTKKKVAKKTAKKAAKKTAKKAAKKVAKKVTKKKTPAKTTKKTAKKVAKKTAKKVTKKTTKKA